MIKVIINADDLGKSHEVNIAIAEALRNKHITSSTIMANNQTWDEVHSIIRENSDASFGVHLNLTEGKALTDSKVLRRYGVVDNSNCFTKSIRKLNSYPVELQQAVYDELDAQINKVMNIEGISITHFDGHHHIHADYAFAEIICRLGEKYDVHKIRNRYYYPRGKVYGALRLIARIPGLNNVLRKAKGSGKLGSILQREAENTCWQNKIKKVFTTTDYFNAYLEQTEMLKGGLHLSDNTVIELMCHPGHPDFLEEYMIIKDMAIEKNINSEVAYINYGEL